MFKFGKKERREGEKDPRAQTFLLDQNRSLKNVTPLIFESLDA
jgi:hypothetical protein